ncbi:hypothetical protein [Embleya sp. NPDC059237]|uniref:hypothetical protein n=1 Tax=Embleya sp. NPDC059237 TaxID=3346784 RepID=UPI0036766F41
MDDIQDVTIEPVAWSRWLSCVTCKPRTRVKLPVRVVRSGLLFDTIEAPRGPANCAIRILIEDKNVLGPVAVDADRAWALVPPGVHSSWSELVTICDARIELVSCVGPGTTVHLPAQAPQSGAAVEWLVPPTLDEDGLPVLTDPLQLLDALRQCAHGAAE